jgi:hypothetical protein
VAAARRMPLAVISLVVLMLTPPVATAASGADPSNPALDQYVESVPSSHGNHPGPPSAGSQTDPNALPPSVRSQIQTQGGSDAQQLEAVGSSPALGAPPEHHARRGDGGTRAPRAPTRVKPEEKSPSLLSSVAKAATDGGDSAGLLIVGLVLLTAALGGTALVRRRVSSS